MEYKSVNKTLEQSFKDNWDRPALSNYKGLTLKYKDVAQRIKYLHIAFEQCGLQKGDKVVSARGTEPDIINASVKAYISGVNRLLRD